MKKPARTLIASAGILVLGLTACGSGGDADASADPLRVGVEEPDRLIPGDHYASYDILFALFDPLAEVTDDGELEHVAAESIESEDATTWTVTLREEYTWHDGDPVTAQDYVDTWNHAAYGPNAWVNGAQLSPVLGYSELNPEEGEPEESELEGLEVVDDQTFTVELANPDRQFPVQLTSGQTGLYPLPASALEDIEAWEENPIGNGPYQINEGWSSNEPIEMTAYEDYAGEEPNVDAVTFVPYVDTEVAYTDALAGEIDIAGIAAHQVVQAREDFGDKVHELDAPGVDFLGFDLEDERFADPDIRRAISMAIDRDAINEAIFGGSQIPATSLTSPTMPGDPDGVCGEYCEFDPEAARELLEEAGGLEGPVEILYVANFGQDDLFEAIANQLRQNLELEEVSAVAAADFADFQQRIEDGDAGGPYRARWGALYPSQQNTLQAIYTPTGEGNFGAGGYAEPEVEELLAEVDAAETLEESFEGYEDVQERILEDFPTVPLFGNRYLQVTSDRVADMDTVAGGIDITSVVLND